MFILVVVVKFDDRKNRSVARITFFFRIMSEDRYFLLLFCVYVYLCKLERMYMYMFVCTRVLLSRNLEFYFLKNVKVVY